MKDIFFAIIFIVSVIVLVFAILFGGVMIRGYVKIDNVCKDLGITSVFKCGFINPAFQSQDIQQRINGNLNINLE